MYPCPETPSERREMAVGVMTRIEDVQIVSEHISASLIMYVCYVVKTVGYSSTQMKVSILFAYILIEEVSENKNH